MNFRLDIAVTSLPFVVFQIAAIAKTLRHERFVNGGRGNGGETWIKVSKSLVDRQPENARKSW